MRSHGKGEANIHPGGVVLYRCVEKAFDFGEGDDLIELGPYLRSVHPEDRAIQVNIFPPRELGMKPRADLEQGSYTPFDLDPACARFRDAGEDFQEGRFSGAVPPDDADNVAALHFKGYVAQRPKLFSSGTRALASGGSPKWRFHRVEQHVAEAPIPESISRPFGLMRERVALASILNRDDDIAH